MPRWFLPLVCLVLAGSPARALEAPNDCPACPSESAGACECVDWLSQALARFSESIGQVWSAAPVTSPARLPLTTEIQRLESLAPTNPRFHVHLDPVSGLAPLTRITGQGQSLVSGGQLAQLVRGVQLDELPALPYGLTPLSGQAPLGIDVSATGFRFITLKTPACPLRDGQSDESEAECPIEARAKQSAAGDYCPDAAPDNPVLRLDVGYPLRLQAIDPAGAERPAVACEAPCPPRACAAASENDAEAQKAEHLNKAADHMNQVAEHLAAAGLASESAAVRQKALALKICGLQAEVKVQREENARVRRQMAELERKVQGTSKVQASPAIPEHVVLSFEASWCSPCQQMLPIVTRLRREGLPLERIDIERHRELAEKYEIRSLPTYVLIGDGEVLAARQTGAVTETVLREMLAQIPKDGQARSSLPRRGPRLSPQDLQLTEGAQEVPAPPQLKSPDQTLPSPYYLTDDIQYFPMPKVAAPKFTTLTNADVLEMLAEGLDEAALIQQIRNSDSRFRLSAEDVAALKAAGATEAVVQQMRKGKLRELIGQ